MPHKASIVYRNIITKYPLAIIKGENASDAARELLMSDIEKNKQLVSSGLI